MRVLQATAVWLTGACLLASGCGRALKASKNRAPVAVLAAVAAGARAGEAVTLDGSGSHDDDGHVVTWKFDFGDGTAPLTSALAKVSHSFPDAGTFTVGLTVSDDAGAQGATSTVVAILPAPGPCRADADCAAPDICADDRCGRPDCVMTTDCKPGRSCVSGRCACGAPRTSCGEDCVDLVRDPKHCGSCALRCKDAQACVRGACRDPLPCMRDAECDDNHVCVEGNCACPPGLADCGGGPCVDVRVDTWNCGACGQMCFEHWSCTKGACARPRDCTTDAECARLQTCVTGLCGCLAPYQVCGQDCVDWRSEAKHCGACGNACAPGEACAAGKCVAAPACAAAATCLGGRSCSDGHCGCPTSLADCAAGCVDLDRDADNCGACGRVCGDPHVCEMGKCLHKRGDVLETFRLPTAEPLVGLDWSEAGGFTFWGNVAGGDTLTFGVLLGSTVSYTVPNPDPSGHTRPFGLAHLGKGFFTGLYDVTAGDGPSTGVDLWHYAFAGVKGIGGDDEVFPDIGGACSLGPGQVLYVFQNPDRKLLTLDPLTRERQAVTTVTGLAADEVVWDIAWDGTSGTNVWLVGMRYAGGAPAGAFIKIVDPTTGIVAASVKPPDPDWASAATWVFGNIWIGGKTALYRVQP